MNEQDIAQLLTELYAIDPSFQQHEAELRQLIIRLAASQPQAHMDEHFQKSLRHQLLTKARTLQNIPPEDTRGTKKWLAFAYSLASVAIIATFIVIVIEQRTQHKTPTPHLVAGGLHVSQVAANAFGQFNTGSLATAPATFQTGREINKDTSSTGTSTATSGSSGTPGTTQPAPAELVNYHYTYEGALPTLAATMPVYKRQNSQIATLSAGGLSDVLGLNLINLNTFNDLTIQNISLAQDSGYSMNIDLTAGTIYIYSSEQLVKGVPLPATDTSGSAPQTNQAPTLSDAQLIKIADSFMSKHHINLQAYGQPQVDTSSVAATRAAANFGMAEPLLYPQSFAQVIYPLQIDNQKIYSQYGQIVGMTVSIDAQQEKVTSVSNLMAQTYQSSNYQTISNTDTLKAAIAQGGPFGYQYSGATKTVTVKLSAPTTGLVDIYKTNNAGETEDYLVPALIFSAQPDQNIADDNLKLYQPTVVIPLVKDFYDTTNQGGGTVIPPDTGTTVNASSGNMGSSSGSEPTNK
jgi:hypothetical protein